MLLVISATSATLQSRIITPKASQFIYEGTRHLSRAGMSVPLVRI